MIVDAHVHIHPDPKGFGDNYDASLDNLLSQMNQVSLDKVILLPIAPDIPNSFVAEACKKNKRQLLGFASIDPHEGNDALTKLEQDVLKYNLIGLKLHPRLQNITLEDCGNLVKLIKKCTQMNLPIVIDAFCYGKNIFKIKSLELINQLAIEVPNAKIIIGHSGAYKIFDAMLIAKAHKNIYLDLSFSLLYYRGSSIIKDLGYVVRKIGSERFIYGSDFPQYTLHESLKVAIEFMDSIGLKDAEKDNILGQNACRIFRIR